jgi:transglutaminase-like putative cysteine protease
LTYWHTFDPRNNIPRIVRVLIARGRDASDVALSSSFGPSTLLSFKVRTDEVPAETDSALNTGRIVGELQHSGTALPLILPKQ